jgi:protein-tyrosine phosphatase
MLGTYRVARGTVPAALSVTQLVACLPTAEFGPPPTTCREYEVLLRHEDLRTNFYERLARVFKEVEAGLRAGKGVLFWCRRGRHRSAAVLAMFVLRQRPGLTPDEVMQRLVNIRPAVQFFEEARVCGHGFLHG